MAADNKILKMAVGLVLAAVSVTGFASTFIFGQALTQGERVSPEVLSFMRFVIAVSVMLFFEMSTVHGRRLLFSVSRADILSMALLGPVGTTLMAWFVFMGCARVSAANASMADALTPLIIFAVSAIVHRRIAVGELLGLGCGFMGALLVIEVVGFDGIRLEAYRLGDVFILLSAIVWGIYTVLGRRLIVRLGSTVFTIWTMLFGLIALGVILPFGHFAWPCGLRAWSLTFGLGLVSTLMPFWCWNAAQKFLPISVLGISAYFTPVVAVSLAIPFLGEHASVLQWCGTVLVVLSAAIEINRR